MTRKESRHGRFIEFANEELARRFVTMYSDIEPMTVNVNTNVFNPTWYGTATVAFQMTNSDFNKIEKALRLTRKPASKQWNVRRYTFTEDIAS